MATVLWYCILALVGPVWGQLCPLHHERIQIDGDDKCVAYLYNVRPFHNATVCKRRLVTSDLPHLKDYLKRTGLERVWVEAKRHTRDGPFYDRNSLQPLAAVASYSGECLAYDIATDALVTEACDQRHNIVCLVDPVSGVDLPTEGCPDGFFYLDAPVPTCLTKRVTMETKQTRKDLTEHCHNRGGFLMQDGYIHTNNAFLLEDNPQLIVIAPLGCSDNGTMFNCENVSSVVTYWYIKPLPETTTELPMYLIDEYYSLETANRTYRQVVCEQKPNIPVDKIVFAKRPVNGTESLVVTTEEGKRSLPEIACFTDNGDKLSPNRLAKVDILKVDDVSAKLLVLPGNGNYWCNAVGQNFGRIVNDSDVFLWIGDEKLAEKNEST